MHHFSSFDFAIHPDELAMLEGVLHKALEERNLSIGSKEAEELAKRIIELHQTGHRDPAQIWEMMRTI
ncbi:MULTISPECIES: hypothetical protein [unclassified Ensifer]|uniref:hypothetical protein n=1 Tax=unclassified Ensifer TaxID=2633371 RepID=UPI00042E723D|nr:MULTISPECIES: hypothetical protein [unclassified Ensifer]AHK47276.1 hypothetical protein OV14_b0945 [Ensifer adhaerens OV14]MBD9491734.1 hypothetical protein [Ensifer sp. ENS11]MDP9634723.1 hypothetical protein [Ensifer adhaerens]OMQ38847.1 hypothetical protein BKP54_31485 [Ensifer sp. 1H6]